MKIYPESSLLTSVFVPDFFNSSHVSTSDSTLSFETDFAFENDITGSNSIIRLNKVPYIDLSKYDYERQQWYHVDQFDGIWRKYTYGDAVVELQKTYGGDSAVYFNKNGLFNGNEVTSDNIEFNEFVITRYEPISLSINNVLLTDIGDYSGANNIIPKLDNVSPSNNMQFYYDGKMSIYTNQDFSLYENDNIHLSFYVNIDNISVSCRMNTNVKHLSPYTPVVDWYIAKLTGQNL